MGLTDRMRRLRYVLQPWRYETEYARAWCEIDFPLYGLASDAAREQRMGPKGRSGRMQSGVWQRLPPMFWTRMTHLGVIESTGSWKVTVDSRVDQAVPPLKYLEERIHNHVRRRNEPNRDEIDTIVDNRSVLVDGELVQFDGVAAGSLWLGASTVGAVSVTVLAEGLPSEQLALHEIIDPAPYLMASTHA
ncbi:MAG: hypothetical protein AAGA42_17340 [Actinomycetota bacterium]